MADLTEVQQQYEAWWAGRNLPEHMKAAFWMVWQASYEAARSAISADAVPAQASAVEVDLLAALQKASKLLRAAGFCMTGTATSQIVAAINAAAQLQPQGVPSALSSADIEVFRKGLRDWEVPENRYAAQRLLDKFANSQTQEGR